MIVERLKNPALLFSLPPRLSRALDYLRVNDLRLVPLGRHDIDGDRLFALVQEYTTRSADQCVWEAHRKYVDVQFVAIGVERMGYRDISRMEEREPYDAARDVTIFEPGTEFVTIREGMFAIFGPEDVHSPCHAAGEPAVVRKVVVKAAVDGLTTAS